VRSLSAEEALLWGKVTASIRPLSRERPTPPRNGQGDPTKAGGADPPSRRFDRDTRPPSASRPVPLPVPTRNTLDASWDRRLRTGVVEPDRVLDLHGLTLDSAWAAIDSGLERAIARGERIVLLITGHHRPGEPPVKRGKIRAAVHDWLAASRHAASIAAVRAAHRRHGGGGSLYLVLRRR
jgi:DNA-nicking Smr family endonuclease